MSGEYILVIDDEPDIRQVIQEILEDEGYEVSVAQNAGEARKSRQSRRPDLTLLDIWMPDTDGISLLKEWSDSAVLDTPVIMMSGHGTVETAVEATRLGAYDFIEKPLSLAKLLLSVENALEAFRLSNENSGLKSRLAPVDEPVGKSTIMQSLRDQLLRIAEHDTNVLLQGEPGSGKHACARYVHNHSSRSQAPFINVSVSALSNDENATELFGSEQQGNFHYGWLEQANGGTLYLEDIADMPLHIQSRLTSAIQHQSFLRVNGQEPVDINVRIIAGTGHILSDMLNQGDFKEELYYLLNIVPVNIPPLREHCEDIPELLEYFVNRLVSRDNLDYRHFNLAAQNYLRNHQWPGNLRELQNLIQRLLILGGESEITQDEVKEALGQDDADKVNISSTGFDLPLREARDLFEKNYLGYHLKKANGNVSQVALTAGVERTHLYRKLRALGLGPNKK